MAQDVTIAGASYTDVPSINVPKTAGGTANFVDAEELADKADKVSNATSGHYAGLDSNGNLTDSGVNIGTNLTVSGLYSHAEGEGSETNGEASHAEGYQTLAYGFASHAEGETTTAAGSDSHAEGFGTYAGFMGHAEGYYSRAESSYQHAEGKCNIADNADTYAHIVGNGSSNNSRSNAHTLDWNGNAWFAGEVYVGSTSGTNKDSGSKKLASEDDIARVETQITSLAQIAVAKGIITQAQYNSIIGSN